MGALSRWTGVRFVGQLEARPPGVGEEKPPVALDVGRWTGALVVGPFSKHRRLRASDGNEWGPGPRGQSQARPGGAECQGWQLRGWKEPQAQAEAPALD